MDAEVSSALWDLEAAFVAHVPRVLDDDDPTGPGAGRVALEHPETASDPDDDLDVGAWVLALGVTLGGPTDVRSLTPWLLGEVVHGERIDLHTALTRIAEFWADWTPSEVDAVRGLVDALWRSVLDRHPGAVDPRPDAPPVPTAVAFLDAAGGLGDDPDRFLAIWEYKDTASADHHLAELIVDAFYGARVHPAVLAWALAPAQRDRVRRALHRDGAEPWAGDLAAAAELLPD